MTHYRHTQYLSGKMLLVVTATLLIIAVVLAVPGFNPVTISVFGLALLLLSQFSALTVEVDNSGIRCRFGVGLIRKRISIDDVMSAQRVNSPWYYGYGVRLTPHGWMFNVSGNEAVELELKNGKRFRIGSDEPAALLRAIAPRAGSSR